MASVTLTDRLMASALTTFGFFQAPDAIFALNLLIGRYGIDNDEKWGPVFDKNQWDATLVDFHEYVQKSGGTDSDAARLAARLPTWRMLYQLEVLPEAAPAKTGEGTQVSRLGYEPVDLGSVFYDQMLYYPVETLVSTKVRGEGGETRNYEDLDVVVVRSDRTLQTQVESASAGRSRATPIYRLTDGTLLRERLTATQHATWSWDSVSAYLHQGYRPPPLCVLTEKINQHLKAKVWLPDADDYWLLTFVAILSYVQAIFDAVPLILLNGKGGTGKSGLGTALANVSCNATVIGKSSASSMIRLMNETNGLTVIDDLESIGAAAGKDKFNEMVQVLKVSYTKSTATKLVTNTRRKPQIMGFFGVKVISNTSGVDAILGSRMLHVHTQNIPISEVESFLGRPDIPASELKDLRNDLHCWAFESVVEISRLYSEMSSSGTRREDEITTPLHVLAQMSGIPEAVAGLKRSIDVQREKKMAFSKPEEALRHVVSQAVQNGLQEVTILELSLKLRQAMRHKTTPANRPAWMKPEWISKRIREWGLVQAGGGRKVMYGYQSRTVTLRVDDSQASPSEKVSVDSFCTGCGSCPFKALNCEMSPYRQKWEGGLSR